ncbi:hypothetical protein EV421DRAFT_1737849 [Armillaria borealis]|uniref:Uncharacterized protein n=1 Tax=Armillaria borealis TaxID=47425 RepID=A0AA39MMM6_9AGAR|nr:hypothetical protein EV421DRAFT_1737849 [Armillaria borealis]
MDRFWYRNPSGAEALNNYKCTYLDRNMPNWYRNDKEEPHSNSPYKQLKNLKKTKRTPRKSRVAQQDDTLAGPFQDALCLSNSDDSSGSWYSIYNGDALLVARTGVCSNRHPKLLNTKAIQRPRMAPKAEMDTWIAGYSQRADDNLDAPLGDSGNDLEPRSDGEPLSDVELSKAYAASGDEFCVYDQLREVYTFQVNDDDTPWLLHFSPSKRRLEVGHVRFIRMCPEMRLMRLESRTSLGQGALLAILESCPKIEALHISGHDRSLLIHALVVARRLLIVRSGDTPRQHAYSRDAEYYAYRGGKMVFGEQARWRKTEVKARKRFGPNGAFKETFDEDLQTRMINGSRRPECKSPNTIDLLRPYSGTQLITPDQ